MCLHLTFEALVIAGCHDVYNEHNNLKLKRMKERKKVEENMESKTMALYLLDS